MSPGVAAEVDWYEAMVDFPSGKEKVYISAVVVELPDGYAVLQLTKVYDSKLHDENTVKEIDFLKSLAVLWGRFEYQLLIDNLMHKAKIKIIEEPIDNKKV